MRTCLAVVTASFLLASAPAAPVPRDTLSYIDLQPKGNQELKKDFHGGGYQENHLGSLPKGIQTLARVKFKIGNKLIQLGGVNLKKFPEKVEGIKIGKRFARLHLLQACGHTANEGQVIGEYIVHYEDKKTAKIEIAFGKDVRDWWFYKDTAGVSRGKVAWEGSNPSAEKNNARIRLYMTTWQNPRPGKRVVSIDFVSKMATAEPFLVAMTAEEK